MRYYVTLVRMTIIKTLETIYSREGAEKGEPFILLVCVCLVAQSCLTLCDLMDCSLPGPSVHGISQARKLEWVSIPFSRGSSQPGILTHVSCITGGFFTIWTIREVLISYYSSLVLSRVIRLSVPWTYFISSWLKDLHTYNYLYLGCPSYRLQHGSCPHITSMPMCL